jgi:hypothetical protein
LFEQISEIISLIDLSCAFVGWNGKEARNFSVKFCVGFSKFFFLSDLFLAIKTAICQARSSS